MGNFKIIEQKGFHLTFDNGITLSTQFGPSNYCEHHPDLATNHGTLSLDAPKNEDVNWESKDAEIAIWDSDRTWITNEMLKDLYPSEASESHETRVKGRVGMEDWLKILDWCRKYE